MFSRQLPDERELLHGLPVPVEQGEWIAMFYMYGDDSGKLENSDYTSLCGYIATAAMWNGFSEAWKAYQFRWQVPAIHMARIMHPDRKDDQWKKIKDAWGKSWEAKRDAMLLDFAELIRNSGIVCVGAIVDATYFRKVTDSNPEFKKLYRNPIYMAFHTFVRRGIDKTEVTDKHSPIGIVIDDNEQFAMEMYKQLNTLRKVSIDPQIPYDDAIRESLKRVNERIHSICFVDDVSYPGIQAADMISYESCNIMRNPDAKSDLYDRLTFYRANQPGFYRPEVIDELQVSLQEGIASGKVVL